MGGIRVERTQYRRWGGGGQWGRLWGRRFHQFLFKKRGSTTTAWGGGTLGGVGAGESGRGRWAHPNNISMNELAVDNINSFITRCPSQCLKRGLMTRKYSPCWIKSNSDKRRLSWQEGGDQKNVVFHTYICKSLKQIDLLAVGPDIVYHSSPVTWRIASRKL